VPKQCRLDIDIKRNNWGSVVIHLDFEQRPPLPPLFGMFPEQSNSVSYRERAAICAWCAKETASAEAAAALLYLEQMYILIAEVAEVIEGNRSHASLSNDPHHSSRE
jgi:hypothetical protein